MHKIVVFIALFLGSFLFSQEEEETHPPTVHQVVKATQEESLKNEGFYPADSLLQQKVTSENKVYPKQFDISFQSKYKGNQYDYTLTKPKKSFWERLRNRFSKLMESIFGKMNFKYNPSLLETILKILGIILGAFLLFFVLRFFFDKKRRSIFGKKNTKLDIEAEELHENIHEINFPEMILNFESKKDYRSAVRYQFLFLLKKLNQKNIIIWNPEKTNRDYEIEIQDTQLQEQYSTWSSIFEYVWYGEFDITTSEYQKLKQELETAKF